MVVRAIVVLLVLCTAGIALPRAQAAGPVTVTIDADASTPAIETAKTVSTGQSFNVAVLVGNVSDVEAFNFEVTYDQTKLSSPTISSGSDLDRNPDANQAVLTSTGRTWSCSPPPPSGDDDPSPTVGAAFLSCYSSGAPAGPTFGSPGSVVATIQFTAIATATTALGLRNVNVFKSGGAETGSCNPVVVVAATCTGATVGAAPSVGGISEDPDIGLLRQSGNGHDLASGGAHIELIAGAGAALAIVFGISLAIRRRWFRP